MDTRNESYRLQQLQRIRDTLALLSGPISDEDRQRAALHLDSIRPHSRQHSLFGAA